MKRPIPKRRPVRLTDRALLAACAVAPLDVTRNGIWRGREIVTKSTHYFTAYQRFARNGWVSLRPGSQAPKFGTDLQLLKRGPIEHTIRMTALGARELEILTENEEHHARAA